MAHAKKSRKRRVARKTTTTRRRRVTRRKSSIMGLPKIASSSRVFDMLKKGGLMALGFMGGRIVEKKFITDAPGFKKFIGPIGQLGGGYVLAQMKNETMKYIGYGLVGGGLISGVGKVFGKDFVADGINGLAGLGDLRQLISGPYDNPEELRLPQFPISGTADYPQPAEIDGGYPTVII